MSETQIYKGGHKISNFYLGIQEAKEVYLGTKCIYRRGPEDGTIVTDSFYTYTFNKFTDGWSARVTSPDLTREITTPPATSIQGKYIIDYGELFANCKAHRIYLKGIDSSHVIDMHSMFFNCSVESIDVSMLDTSNTTTLDSMFACMRSYISNKTHISGLVNFRTPKVQYFSSMFYDTDIVLQLDLSNCTVHPNADLSYMFEQCNARVAYARTVTERDRFNDSAITGKPNNWSFQVK